MNCIRLNNILVNENRIDYYFSVSGELKKYFSENNHLFLEYNYNLADVPKSILSIPFVSNIAPLIWITGSTIQVEFLDQSFYRCLDSIKNSYQKMFPNIKFDGNIDVQNIEIHEYIPEIEAASLFSGGLDALTTYIRIKEKNPLLITEYGWHGNDIEYSEVWEADKKNAINFANLHGLKNILIQSNYGTFLNAKNIDRDFGAKLGDTWWHGLHHGLAIISSAIPISYKIKLKCIYIASSNSPAFPFPCASDPTVDNKIQYASGRVYHDAYELTRQDKVRTAVDYHLCTNEKLNIRVCFKNEENCCKCEKCLRTIFGIIAEGQNPRDFGFNVPSNTYVYLKEALNNEVKFFTDSFITMYWESIKNKMKENYNDILYQDLRDWFLNYNFKEQRKVSLLKYRTTQFFPILKRKISNKLERILL